jgi:hypothetical protein
VRAPGARLVATALAAIALAGCGGTVVAPTPTSPTSAPSPSPSLAPSTSARASAGDVVVDPGLLDVLPADVDGLDLMVDAETAAELAALDLPDEVRSLAVGLYVDPAGDLAVVNVVGIEPGTATDEWFRAWRDSYDASACEVAGGVEPGHAETEIGGRQTFIGTCVQGAHTYHVQLNDPDRIVSINAVGEGRLGEGIVAGLGE